MFCSNLATNRPTHSLNEIKLKANLLVSSVLRQAMSSTTYFLRTVKRLIRPQLLDFCKHLIELYYKLNLMKAMFKCTVRQFTCNTSFLYFFFQ